MALTDAQIKAAQPGGRLSDGGGLVLEVSPKGVKSWRVRVYRNSKERIVTLGRYPDMGLKAARAAAANERGKAPAEDSETFGEVARLWHKRNAPRWKEKHAASVMKALERHAFPAFGDKMVNAIRAPIVMKLLLDIEAEGKHDHAHDVRGWINGVFEFAVAAGLAEVNPAASMSKVMQPIPKRKHHPALTSLDKAREMLRAVESVPARPVLRLAARISMLCALRPGEIRHGRWQDLNGLDSDEPGWFIPHDLMKHKKAEETDRSHYVALPVQAVAAFRILKRLTGSCPYMFAHPYNPALPMSENAVNDLLERAGYKGIQTAHGFRSTFSTIMNEAFPADNRIIETMLAHKVKGDVEGAYNQAQYIRRRRELAQAWADMLLDGFSEPERLIDLPRRAPNRKARE